MIRSRLLALWSSLAALAALGGLLTSTGNAYSQTVDQQQVVYNGGTSARTLPGYTVWQSFTAGLTGTLTEIDMGFFNTMSGQAQLQIFAGEATTGPLLQSIVVPVQGITQPAVTWNAWSVNVPVTAGSVYTFNIIPDAATLPDPYGVCIGSGSPYAGGVMGLNDPSGASQTAFDVVFRTFVTASTPPVVTGSGLVVPNAYASTPAEMQVVGGAAGHYQQVFSGSEFWPAGEAHTITAMAWRPGNALNPGTYTWSISQFDVYVCTTTKAVDGLSTLFAENYAGASDRTLVYSGPITFRANVTTTGGLNAFDVVIPFQTAFSYDPAKGNLLIDVTGYSDYENLWDAQVDLVGASSLTSYLWGDHRYSDGTINGFSGAGLVTRFTTDYVAPAQVALSSIALEPSALVGGESAVGTVTLAAPALAGGQTVTLSSDSPEAAVVASVLVPEGATTAQFAVTTTQVPATVVAWITAGAGGTALGVDLKIDPAPVTPTSVSLAPSSVTGGAALTGTVTLSGPAPATGIVLSVGCNSASASVPASVTVPGGASSVSFPIQTSAVSVSTSANITATCGTGSASAMLTVNPAVSSSASLYNLDIASSMRSGSKTTGKIEITPAAPAGGATVQLTSSNPAAVSVPSSVFIAAGKKQVAFNVSAGKVSKATTVTVTARLGTSQKTVSVTVNP